MGRSLFMRLDPRELDRYTKTEVPRRRRLNLETVKNLDLLRRALQNLPPRELQMLYEVKVLRVEQDEVTEIFNVRQSNISYRLERAHTRIRLHTQIASLCSETTLRRVLYDVGLAEQAVRAVLGVVKTSSQSTTAGALGVTQGSVRHLYANAIEKLEQADGDIPDREQALELLRLIEMNYNQLKNISTQKRWRWKIREITESVIRELTEEEEGFI